MKATVDGVSHVNIYLCTMSEWTTDAVPTLPICYTALSFAGKGKSEYARTE
jgi:hypothetical protein